MLTLNEVFDNNRDKSKKVKLRDTNGFLQEWFENIDERKKSIDLDKFDLKKGNADSEIEELKLDLPQGTIAQINNLINEIKTSNKSITEVSKQCIEFIQLAEKGIDKVNEKSGFFSRIWGAITGETQKTKLQSKQHLANAMRAAVQIINEMNKQMLLTQEQILMLENLLKYMITEEKEFRKELKLRLEGIFIAVKKRFELIEKTIYDLAVQQKNTQEILEELVKNIGQEIGNLWKRTDVIQEYIIKLERQVETLEWIQLIDAYGNDFDNWKDKTIHLFMKTVFEFYEIKHGYFTYKDLLLFSSALKKLGFNFNDGFTLRVFIEQYCEEFFETQYHKQIGRFLQLETDQNKIENIVEGGYFSQSSEQTQFIKTLSVVNYAISHVKMEKGNVVEKVKSLIKNFNTDNTLQLDNPVDWFLLACEILTYKRTISSPEIYAKDSITREIIGIIETGMQGNDQIEEKVKLLFLDDLALKLKKNIKHDIVEKLKRKNFGEIIKFTATNADPRTFIEYDGDIEYVQLEFRLNETTYVGIYAKVEDDKLLVSSLISFLPETGGGLTSRFKGEHWQKYKLHSDYESYGTVLNLTGTEADIKNKLDSVPENILKILYKLVE